VDSEYGANDLIEYSRANNDVKFHVYVDIDSGYHRTGFDPSSDSVFTSIKSMKEAGIDIVGLYTHGGDSYHANGSTEAAQYAERETKVIVDFSTELKKRLDIELDIVAVGSTPTCSNPPTASAGSWGSGATEIHPGNCTHLLSAFHIVVTCFDVVSPLQMSSTT
jgi:D-serine deaminase-like pyridoxal phosphate-dependent protein